MFEIKYRLVLDMNEINSMSLEEFDKEYDDLEGIIELNFNGSKIGETFEGEITEEMYEAGCFQEEWVTLWFRNPIKAAKLLVSNNYVMFSEIEAPVWIELTKSNNLIKVRELREVYHKIEGMEDIDCVSGPLMDTKPIKEEIALKSGEIFFRDVKMEETSFKENFITATEFQQEIKNKSNMLLTEIKEMFPDKIKSKLIKTLEESINSIKDI